MCNVQQCKLYVSKLSCLILKSSKVFFIIKCCITADECEVLRLFERVAEVHYYYYYYYYY
jgi:hypothetical protein